MIHHRSARFFAIALLPVVVAACASDAHEAATSPGATLESANDTPGSATAASDATATTAVPATTTAPESTVAPTTDAPTTTIKPVRDLDATKILHEGQTYAAGTTALGVDITFTANKAARWATNLPGFFGVSTQASGDDTLLYITDLSVATVFKNPLDDYVAFGRDNNRIFAATEPIPGEYLEYFRALPGVTTGEIVDATMFGRPARSMTFTIGSNEGGHAIPPGPEPLLLTFFSPSGVTYTYLPGDSGTLYSFELAGKPILAEVTTVEGAAEFAEQIEVAA
jgi:hypothetical protein